MSKKRTIITVAVSAAIVLAVIVFLVSQSYGFASSQFIDDGYILTMAEEETPDDSVNVQYYFNKGEKFAKKYPEKIVFKNTDGKKVAADQRNFVHYQTGSMNGLAKSVIMDTDALEEQQISYYSVSTRSVVEKAGDGYQISNAGETVNLTNFIWKISDNQYMLVSPNIDLCISEEAQQSFDGYVELLYRDEGVVYLVNQDGTYSTVSSDAYLELSNGKRIYMGSKNVSDGEVVLMNLTQMLIDSDDNIEIIPDEEYKNEKIEQPTINMDVQDGEDGPDGDDAKPGIDGTQGEAGDPGEAGKAGSVGENGTNGSNGSAGSSGSSGRAGAPGSAGEDADNSDVVFNPETMPQFTAEIDPSAFGMKAAVSYDSNECNVTGTTVSILDATTGAEIWKKDIYADGTLAQAFDLRCDILKQDTEYVLVFSSTYTSGTQAEPVTQDVYKKVFRTLSFGVKLEKKYSTEDYIVLDLIKEKESAIETVSILYYDKDLNLLGHGTPIDEEGREYDSDTGAFKVSDLNEGDKVSVMFGGLDRNSVYYMQIRVMSLTEGTDVSIIPSNSFPVQKFMTLKKAPEIGKPKVVHQEISNSFILSPSTISDPDNGISSIRYEIYEATQVTVSADGKDYSFSGDPIISVDKEKASSIEVPIDGEKIRTYTDYVARIVAIFYNNDETVEYGSPLSEIFNAGESVWPTFSNEYNSYQLTASTIEGTLIIKDPNNVIDSSYGYGLKITYASNLEIDGEIKSGEIIVDNDMLQLGSTNGVYEIPYAIKGLRQETPYTITVTAAHMQYNGKSYLDKVIGNDSFTTKVYSPLYVEGRENISKNTAFSVNVVFKASDQQQEEKAAQISSNIPGLENMGHFTGKSLSFLRFAIYAPKDPVHPEAGPADTPYKDLSEAIVHLGSSYPGAENWRFSSDFWTGAYLESGSGNLDSYAITLDESMFGLTADDLTEYQGQTFFVKVTAAMDYTFGNGGSDKLYENNNIIPIGTTDSYTGDDADRYIEVTINHIIPPFPSEDEYTCRNITKYVAESKRNNDPEAYNSENSNFDETILSDPLWADIDDNTEVGFAFRGADSLAKHSSAVKYTVRDKSNNVVADSGWMNYDTYDPSLEATDPANLLPEWNFFLNIKGKGDRSVGRGEEFTVETQVKLKYVTYDDKPDTPMSYPDDFIDGASIPGRILYKGLIEKEEPVFWVLPWEGSTESHTEDILYVKYRDVDAALEYADNNEDTTATKLNFYNGNSSLLSCRLGSITDTSAIARTLASSGYMQLKTDLSQKLVVRCVLDGKTTRNVSLMNEDSVLPAVKVQCTEQNLQVSNNQVINISFKFRADGGSRSSLALAAAVFSKGGKEIVIPLTLQDGSTVSVTDPDGSEHDEYEESAEVSASELLDLAGSGTLKCELRLYYDDGKYGMKHLTDGEHYGVQSGSGYASDQLNKSVYPCGSWSIDTNRNIVKFPHGAQCSCSAAGPDLLPKHLTYISKVMDDSLQFVLPQAIVEVRQGFSTAVFDVSIPKTHSLKQIGSNKGTAVLRYREEGSTTWNEIWIDAKSAQSYQESLQVEGLKPNTKYEYELAGYVNALDDPQYITGSSFKTLPEINIVPCSAAEITFIASEQARSTKQMKVPFTLQQVYKADLESISNIKVEVLCNGVSVSEAVFSKSYLLESAQKITSWSDTEKADLPLTALIDWKPDASHIMNDAQNYTVQITCSYDPNFNIQQSEAQISNIIPTSWMKQDDYFAAAGRVTLSSDHTTYDAVFTVSGTDALRVIAGDSDTTVKYYVKLVGKANETFPVQSFTANVDQLGNIEAKTITFTGLQTSTRYYLQIYVNLDLQNEGIGSASGCESGQYSDVFVGGRVDTPENTAITATAATFNAAGSEIQIIGNNLERTKKITYSLVNKTTGATSSAVYEDTDSKKDLTDNFKLDLNASGNVFRLALKEKINTGNDYQITIYFYDESGASERITAVYTSDNSTSGFSLKRIVQYILGERD